MGLFSTPSPFDQRVERATSEKNTEDDWGQIMMMCDKIKESSSGPADALKSISKRLNNENPRIVLQTITLLDACINNCGRKFLLKVAERDFEQELTKLLTSTRTHHKVSEKLRECLKKWAEGEFKGDPELSLIPSLYSRLQQQGYDFNVHENSPKKTVKYSTDPNVVNTQQEEDDIARAIQLSLQNSGSSSLKTTAVKQETTSSNLYSSASAMMSSSAAVETEKEPLKVRALYDFEAAEDNELTFKAGEIILVIDHSDSNWWKGSNHRGEGLFPANFVTEDLHEEAEAHSNRNEASAKKVSFSECVEVAEVPQDGAAMGLSTTITGEIDEEKIDQLLHLLHEADPTGERGDDPSIHLLEEHVNAMAPTIDAELEQIDRKHAQLARISTDLVGALNLYHQLMREMPSMLPYYPPYSKLASGPVSAPPSGVMPGYLPPGNAASAVPQVFQPGQYPGYAPGYMPPNSAMPPGYLPQQPLPGHLPQQPLPGLRHPYMPPQQGQVPPLSEQTPQMPSEFQQIPPTSQANYAQFPVGVPPYGAPLEGNDVTSPLNVHSQSQQLPPQPNSHPQINPNAAPVSIVQSQAPTIPGGPAAASFPPHEILPLMPQPGMPPMMPSYMPHHPHAPSNGMQQQQPLL